MSLPAPSANLSAVAAFSQARAEQDSLLAELAMPDNVPPGNQSQHSASPTSTQRPPSSRRTLTRALELARQAVQLDASNDNPEAAVQAYAHSVALLSEVMERVRRGEDSTDNRRRNGRRRSSAAQEEEVRRLQSIHDTYADRMNILSIIHSIPPIPYTAPSVYSDSNPSSSPTATNSTIDSPPPESDYPQRTNHDPEEFPRSTDAIGSAAYAFDDGSASAQELSGLPPSSVSHPYAAATPSQPFVPQTVVTPPNSFPPTRPSILQRRSRAASAALPPAAPPPSNALPPAPDPGAIADGLPSTSSPPAQAAPYLNVSRPSNESYTLSRTNSTTKLEGLPEEAPGLAATYSSSEDESRDMVTPRHSALQRLPPSPQSQSQIIVPRPRGSSTLTTKSELAGHLVNPNTAMGTIHMRRTTKSSAPPDSRSSSPAESIGSAGSSSVPPRSATGSAVSSIVAASRNRSSSQPLRQYSPQAGASPPDQLPPLPSSTTGTNGTAPTPRKPVFTTGKSSLPSSLSVQINDLTPPPVFGLPTTPTSPLPPNPPSDPLRKPYYMMNLLRGTMESSTGGYVTRRLHVPQEVWSQGGAKLSNTLEKVRVLGILCQALEELQMGSSEYFGAGNVSSGMALGIGSIGKREAESWMARLDDFSGVCEGVVANFGKKLGVGEGFVSKKSTWGDRVTRRFDKFTNGKNLDSPQAYTEGLRRLFIHAQLLDEHTKAIFSAPLAPAYTSFPPDIRNAIESKLRRTSQFFASVVLTFVIRDLSQLLDKYAKKCEKWLAE